MAQWFYYDSNGIKQGPVEASKLKTLAQYGVINEETLVETDAGKMAPASKVKGLVFKSRPEPLVTKIVDNEPGNIYDCDNPIVANSQGTSLIVPKRSGILPSVEQWPRSLGERVSFKPTTLQCDGRDNPQCVHLVPTGPVNLLVYMHGIEVVVSGKPVMKIPFVSIVEMRRFTKSELVDDQKSVVGRSVVGGILGELVGLGAVGAMVGAASAFSSSQCVKDFSYLVIVFGAAENAENATLVFGGEPDLIDQFIADARNPSKTPAKITQDGTQGGTDNDLIIGCIICVGLCIFLLIVIIFLSIN